MDIENLYLPAMIFGLSYSQHRVHRAIEFLTYMRARFIRKSRKARLLFHLAALEKNFFTPDEQDKISRWFSWGQDTVLLEGIIGKRILGSRPIPVECSVCMSTLPNYQFPQKPLAINCDHKPTVCLTCLSQSLEQQITDKPWDHVSCPECPEILDFVVVQEFSSVQTFERYDKKSLLAAFQDIPNFIMCLGPNCASGQIHGGGDDQPIMTCTTCEFRTCFTHKLPWHEGQTCAEYDLKKSTKERRERAEKASAKFLAKNTKQCPNPKCGLNLDKYTGCDHVTCTRCKHEFCWICSASYKTIRRKGNGAHAKNCDYHTDRL